MENSIKEKIKHSPLAAPLTLARMVGAGYCGYPGKWEGEEQQVQETLNSIKENGYYIIPAYYSVERCQDLRDEIDRQFEENKDKTSHDDLIGDTRLFGAEKVSKSINKFNQDPHLQKLSDLYHGEHAPAPFTLAARLECNEINKDKDHGWHRDSLRRQFKAIIYLSDVSEDNGPLQYITGSHHMRNILADGLQGRIPYMSSAIAPESAEKILAKNPARLKTVIGGEGTLILVDTTGIHRGSTIQTGKRYALTNYYMFEDQIGPRLNEYFGPLAYAG